MNQLPKKMNRLITGLTATLLLIGAGLGTIAQEASSLLWKVSGKDMAEPSYIFGTIHMLSQDKYFFTPAMEEALSGSDILALEIDMNVSFADQMEMAKQMTMPDGKTWADYMTADEYEMVKSAFVDSLGIKEKKIDQYSKIRPIYVSGLILAELVGKVKMYEKELTTMAKKEKKEIIGLETFKEQMEIVGSIPVEDQINDLKESSAGIMRDYNKMVEAYLNQDLGGLENSANWDEGSANTEAKLLTDRNERWIKIIQEKLGEKSIFFAVGALHLVGENGLINQLKAAGYTVSPMK
jgi:uncharacterized protein YbaP (TraB family)